jgi:RNA polymerase sigma-54 factor
MLNLQQRQSLQQKLSPQQIQYIKLLQLPTLALEQRIKAELEANPLLEEGDEAEETEVADEPERATEDADGPDDEPAPEASRDDDYDWDEFLHSADDLYGHKAQVDRSDEDDDRRELPIPMRSSVSERVLDQLAFLGFSDGSRLIAEQIIGSVDEDGYLRRSLDSIVDDVMFNHGLNVDEHDVERVLRQVQRLDPVGFAARDLQECLLVQLEMMPPDTPGRADAIRVLQKAYKAFTMKHFEQIKTRLGLTSEELKEAFDLITRLDPKPGEGDIQASQNYVVPDFTVEVADDEFVISLNQRNTPPLRISREYRQMLEELSADQKRERPRERYDSDTKNFLKTRVESARWFIHSIQQRRQTMLKVMSAIVELQADFFREGEGNLRPMILKDVAERIGMDISTISRVVNGKYVQTEFGVYELKYFFSEGLSTDSGEEVSNKEVRAIIERIIAAEDKSRPLSDQHIAEMLEKQGFNIARRTVTKYREQLGVPVARMRKEIVV